MASLSEPGPTQAPALSMMISLNRSQVQVVSPMETMAHHVEDVPESETKWCFRLESTKHRAWIEATEALTLKPC